MRKARELRPDLILMDIVMPGINGFQATRELASDPDTRSIPVIMVTSKAQESDRVWGLRQGAVDYLVKPGRRRAAGARRPRPRSRSEMERHAARSQVAAGPTLRTAAGAGPSRPRPRPRAARGRPCPAREWVGVAFRLGGEAFLVAREETREVMGYPAAVTRVPGAKAWIRGLSNVRGQLLPMIDLRRFLGCGTDHRHPRHARAGRQPPRGPGGPAWSTK